MILNRGKAGVVVDYVSARPLKLRQWTGYSPETNHKYLADTKGAEPPPQWHVEASTVEQSTRTQNITVMRIFRNGAVPAMNVGAAPNLLAFDDTAVERSADGTFLVRRDDHKRTIKP